MKLINTSCLLTLFFAANSLQAQGILVVEKETRDGKSDINQMQINRTDIRAEFHTSGQNSVFLYNAPSQTARVLNLDMKTYYELTRAQIDQTLQNLKNLPPIQRALVEQMLRGR